MKETKCRVLIQRVESNVPTFKALPFQECGIFTETQNSGTYLITQSPHITHKRWMLSHIQDLACFTCWPVLDLSLVFEPLLVSLQVVVGWILNVLSSKLDENIFVVLHLFSPYFFHFIPMYKWGLLSFLCVQCKLGVVLCF